MSKKIKYLGVDPAKGCWSLESGSATLLIKIYFLEHVVGPHCLARPKDSKRQTNFYQPFTLNLITNISYSISSPTFDTQSHNYPLTLNLIPILSHSTLILILMNPFNFNLNILECTINNNKNLLLFTLITVLALKEDQTDYT